MNEKVYVDLTEFYNGEMYTNEIVIVPDKDLNLYFSNVDLKVSNDTGDTKKMVISISKHGSDLELARFIANSKDVYSNLELCPYIYLTKEAVEYSNTELIPLLDDKLVKFSRLVLRSVCRYNHIDIENLDVFEYTTPGHTHNIAEYLKLYKDSKISIEYADKTIKFYIDDEVKPYLELKDIDSHIIALKEKDVCKVEPISPIFESIDICTSKQRITDHLDSFDGGKFRA